MLRRIVGFAKFRNISAPGFKTFGPRPKFYGPRSAYRTGGFAMTILEATRTRQLSLPRKKRPWSRAARAIAPSKAAITSPE